MIDSCVLNFRKWIYHREEAIFHGIQQTQDSGEKCKEDFLCCRLPNTFTA